MAQKLSAGLSKEIVTAGTGARPNPGDTITVHCTGSASADGSAHKKFWSTKDSGQKPFTFQVGLGQVIKGWDEGCLTMAQGEVAKLTISPEKGYGAGGFPSWGIPPNAELLFEIEILSIDKRR